MGITLAAAFLGQLLALANAAQTCTYINTITNGEATYTDSNLLNQVGGKIKFSCKEGFQLNGVQETECTSTGWANPKPTCSELPKCPHIVGLQDGKITNYCNYMGCKPEFECDSPWKLDGAATLTCTASGWDAAVPTCKENWCPPITTFANGDIIGYANPPVPGTVISVQCKDGYVLQDPSAGSATCQADNQWSTQISNCVCDNSCDSPTCPTVVSVPFGDHMLKSNKRVDVVKITSCQEGRSPALGGGRSDMCKHNKAKYYAFPKCVYRRCPHIENVLNGIVDAGRGYGWPHSIKLTCSEGYKVKSTPDKRVVTAKCRENGQWSYTKDFECESNMCPAIEEFPNGKITQYDSKVGGTVTFECDEGYKLEGASSIRCLCKDTLEWSDDVPKCVQTILSTGSAHISSKDWEKTMTTESPEDWTATATMVTDSS